MREWTYEADAYDIDKIPSNFIVTNTKIERYLDLSDKRFFLIGPKGVGKTLLLRYKAYCFYKNQNESKDSLIQVKGANELVESLVFSIKYFSQNELKILSKKREWIKIWKFALSYVIVNRTGIEIESELKDLLNGLNPKYGLSDVISEILNDIDRYVLSNFLDDANKHLQFSLRQITSGVGLFVDRLDQALNNCLEQSDGGSSVESFDDNYHFKVWKCAQSGLLQSCYEIFTINRHIKIFCTARKESLDMKYLKENLKEYTTELEYNYNELKEIFVNNINLIPPKRIPFSTYQNPFQKMFGFSELEHLHAKDQNELPKKEDIFGLIYRHSFGTPREIVLLGRKLFEDVISRDIYKRSSIQVQKEKIRRKVDDTAYEELFKHYTDEIVPTFHHDILDRLLENVQSNVISLNLLNGYNKNEINYLYRLGILGYVKNGVQNFLPAATYVNNPSLMIEKSEYYLLHPSTDRLLQRSLSYEEFYNDNNIVGNGYKFDNPIALAINSSPLEYFLPKKIAGAKGINMPNKNNCIEIPYIKLYEAFFKTSGSKVVNELKKKRIKKSLSEYLSRVADLVILEHLENSGKRNPKWKMAIKNDLKKFYNNWQYLAKIENLDENFLIYFGQRIIGRLFVLGMYCYLRLEPTIINNFLKVANADLDYKVGDSSNALRFLRRAFFIKGLKEHGVNHGQKYHGKIGLLTPEAETILDYASDFERKELKDWWNHYTNHSLLVNQLLSKETKTYIEDNII